MQYYFQVGLLLLLLSSSLLVNGAPPRIFGNKNLILKSTDTPLEGNVPEEELELESLKGHEKHNDVIQPLSVATTKGTSSIEEQQPAANVKRPENEEKPALSDNANSLKFPHHNPGGIDEALLSKKNHVIQHSTQIDNHQHKYGPEQEQELQLHQQQQSSDGDRDRSSSQIFNKYNHLNFQLDYTPQDIAEYVFWTGDEKGVASAIGDFLQDGMVGREQAVRFLEDVKGELNSIRARYPSSLAQGQQSFHHNGFNSQPGIHPGASIRSTKRDYSSPEMTNSFPSYSLDGQSTGIGGRLQQQQTEGNGLGLPGGNLMSVEELDYDEIADKLRTVDAKMREYALQEIIYQIGKDLFAESLKNSPGESTQKFSSFIEAQAANGHIPKDLEKDVLEVLVGAFVDAVDEHGAMGNGLQEQSSQSDRRSHSSRSSSSPAKSSLLVQKNGS